MKQTKNAVKFSLLVGTTLGLSSSSANAENLFSFTNIGEASSVRTALSSSNAIAGLELACGGKKSADHKCGEGKCGGKKGKDHKCGEGKCGNKDKDRKCDEDSGKHKVGDHKCGEGKCGGKADSSNNHHQSTTEKPQ